MLLSIFHFFLRFFADVPQNLTLFQNILKFEIPDSLGLFLYKLPRFHSVGNKIQSAPQSRNVDFIIAF